MSQPLPFCQEREEKWLAQIITEVHITREGLARLQAVPRNTRALLVNINQPMREEKWLAQILHPFLGIESPVLVYF